MRANVCLILTLDWKIASIIAEGHHNSKASPVVYVSGEEVCFKQVFR